MLILKSGITKAPKLKGVSLVSACGLSLRFSSKENLTRVDSFIEYRASDISKVCLNKPEAYFHNYDLYDFAKHLAILLNKGVHIEISVHTDELVNIVGRMIGDGLISEDLVELQLEVSPMALEGRGEIDLIHYDSEGYLKEPYGVGYFTPRC
jgi:hypothetical protein